MKRAFVFAATLLLATAAVGQSNDLAGRLDAALAPLFPKDQPGAAMILTRNGKTVFRNAYGLADVDRAVALRPEMAFRIGSITKQLTAAAIFLLVDEGKVALDDDITKHLPDYPARGKRITVENLLTHSSGIRSYTDIMIEPSTLALDKSVREIIDDFKDEPLLFEPGEAVRYSNSNYILLGAIIERVSRTSYADFMAKRIFGPLGMQSTAYEGFERNGARRIEGYQRGGAEPFEKAQPISMTQPYAAGALISTVDDMARWGAAVNDRRLLSAESWKRMFKPFVLNDGRVTAAASGWFLESRTFERDVYGHAGGINGFASFVYWVPRDRVFVAVLLNHSGQNVSAMRLAQLMLHVALPKPD